MADVDQHSIPDKRSAAELENGYVLAWCLGPGGESWPWLVAQLCDEHDEKATHGCMCRNCVPSHERLGRLPRVMRDALGLVARCGAPRTNGQPCRHVVGSAGQRCGQHAEVKT